MDHANELAHDAVVVFKFDQKVSSEITLWKESVCLFV